MSSTISLAPSASTDESAAERAEIIDLTAPHVKAQYVKELQALDSDNEMRRALASQSRPMTKDEEHDAMAAALANLKLVEAWDRELADSASQICQQANCSVREIHDALVDVPAPGGMTPAERYAHINAAIDKATKPLLGQRASSITIKPTRWIWLKQLPAKIVLISSNPGYGKSTLSCDFSARVSTGRPWPDGSPCERGKVLLFTSEDDSDDTVVPRLKAARADLSQIDIKEYETETGQPEFSLPSGISKLEAAIKRDHYKLVVIDPLESYLDQGINANDNASLRKVLNPLRALSRKYGVCFVIVGHLTKDSETEIDFRHGGSIAKAAAARAVYAVIQDETPDEEAGSTSDAEQSEKDPTYLLVCGKINVGKLPKPWRYKLVEAEGESVSHIEWHGQLNMSAAEIRKISSSRKGKSEGTLEAAKSLLLAILTPTGAYLSDAFDVLAAAQGISRTTVNRAKKELKEEKGLRSVKEKGKNGKWWLTLPMPDPKAQSLEPDGAEELEEE